MAAMLMIVLLVFFNIMSPCYLAEAKLYMIIHKSYNAAAMNCDVREAARTRSIKYRLCLAVAIRKYNIGIYVLLVATVCQ